MFKEVKNNAPINRSSERDFHKEKPKIAALGYDEHEDNYSLFQISIRILKPF